MCYIIIEHICVQYFEFCITRQKKGMVKMKKYAILIIIILGCLFLASCETTCANPYAHQYVEEITLQASCSQKGIRSFTCSLCQFSYTEEIPVLGHSYESKVTKEATTTETGVTTFTCSVCNDSYTEEIEMLDTLLYKVGLLSDVHIQTSATEKTQSQNDYANALNFFSENGCSMVCLSGDLTTVGSDAEFAKYVEVRDANKGNMKVYEVTGNHEAASSRTYTSVITDPTCIAHHIQNLTGNHYCYYVKNGQYTYWNLSPENYTVDTAENVTVYDDSIVLPETDVYIFIGILGDRNGNLFWDEFFQWMYNVLNEHKDKRCFVFEHCRAERLKWDSTAGAYVDDTYKDYVSGNTYGNYLKTLWFQADNSNMYGLRAHTFEALIAHFTNCIWFHGHTHLLAELNEVSDIANVDSFFGDKYNVNNLTSSAGNTKWSWSVHLPSVTEPRTVVDGERVELEGRSQGAMMEVYRNKVVIKYIDFAEVADDGTVNYVNRYIDTAVYDLDTKPDAIGEFTPPTRMVSGEEISLISTSED